MTEQTVSEQNSVEQTSEQSIVEQNTEGKKFLPCTSKCFDRLEDADQFKPASPRARLFQVTRPDGTRRFVWAGGRDTAMFLAAREAGWNVAEHGKGASREKVAQLLGQLTEEDRAVLIRMYVPASAPADGDADKAASKGKRGK